MSRKERRNITIRSRYVLTNLLLFLLVAAVLLMTGIHNYRASREERMETARHEFETAWQELDTFTNRITGLVNVIQYNSSLVSLLGTTEEYSVAEYSRARMDLAPMIFSLEDGSGDYTCRIYIRSSLPLYDPTSRILQLSDVEESEWALTAMKGFGQRQWYSASRVQGSMPAFVAPIRMLDQKTKHVALMRIDVEPGTLLERMKITGSEDYAVCVLLAEEGEVVASRGKARIGEYTGLEENTLAAYGFNRVSVGRDTVFFRRLEKTGWLLSMTVSDEMIRVPLMRSTMLILAGAFALFALGSLLAAPILWNVLRRVERFHRYVQDYSIQAIRGDAPESLESGPDDEVGQLITAYNGMTERIRNLMREQEEQREESRKMEISALQKQINPHFLYNTLEAVNWMAQMDQPAQVESMIRNLSDFYRLCLSGGKNMLPVGQEVRICEHYFQIMMLRSHKDYHLEIQVPEAMQQILLPKITLQPLVENAIVHGLMESGQSGGTVWIRGERRPGGWTLSVEDSGHHFDRETWQRIMEKDPETDRGDGESYGLRNVERRLCLYLKKPEALRLRENSADRTVIAFDLDEPAT